MVDSARARSIPHAQTGSRMIIYKSNLFSIKSFNGRLGNHFSFIFISHLFRRRCFYVGCSSMPGPKYLTRLNLATDLSFERIDRQIVHFVAKSTYRFAFGSFLAAVDLCRCSWKCSNAIRFSFIAVVVTGEAIVTLIRRRCTLKRKKRKKVEPRNATLGHTKVDFIMLGARIIVLGSKVSF